MFPNRYEAAPYGGGYGPVNKLLLLLLLLFKLLIRNVIVRQKVVVKRAVGYDVPFLQPEQGSTPESCEKWLPAVDDVTRLVR